MAMTSPPAPTPPPASAFHEPGRHGNGGGAEVVALKHAHLQESVGLKIVLGGCANIVSSCFTNPVDVVKVRLQLQALDAYTAASAAAAATAPAAVHVPGTATSKAAAAAAAADHPQTRYRGFLHGLRTVFREEGAKGLMKGWQPSFLREAGYSGLRFGTYDAVKAIYETRVFRLTRGGGGGGGDARESTPLYIKIAAGATTGGVGSAIMNPMDLIKVRMQADRSGLRYHNSLIFAVRDILRHDGVANGFYRGVGPTTTRAMVLTAAQLPSYDHAKEMLLTHTPLREGAVVHVACSMFAGLMAATASSPFDVVKTKIMNQCARTAASQDQFQSSRHMARMFLAVLREDGVRGFFKGWLANWMRLGPHTVISLLVYEELRGRMGLTPV
ncbi:hypothetical protein HK405_007944 [Cladochytrium tenue]|nr:hypothetical protein HK405_007944 [Cladochytrium tenue]